MASAAPLYGSILLGKDLSLDELSRRLEWVSQTALQHSDFTAYITTVEGQRYYGLDRQEWLNTSQKYAGNLERLSFSLGIPNSGGVRLNFRFAKSTEQALGQYIIATGHSKLNEIIRDMIQGEWGPERQGELDALRAEPEPPEPKPVEEVVEAPPEEASVPEVSPEPQLTEVSPEIANDTGEEIHVYSEEVENEQEVVAEQEEISVAIESESSLEDPTFEETAPSKEAVEYFQDQEAFVKHFSFNQKKLSLDLLIAVTRAVSDTYMKGEYPWAEVLTPTHRYSDLQLGELKNLLRRQNRVKVRQIRLFSSHPQGDHFFELMFDFTKALEGPKGTLRLQLGDDKKHKTVENLVWDRLGLGYRRVKPAAPRGKKGLMRVNPVFQARTFEDKGLSSLVIMPLEAYWSEAIWMFFQDYLVELGYHVQRADALYTSDKLESIWKALNESEVIIADLTYKHPGIFYMLGVAHTLGKSVILISQHERDVPMDFQAFGYIIYDNSQQGLALLKEELNQILKQKKKHKSTMQ